jgi:hypothetical protein
MYSSSVGPILYIRFLCTPPADIPTLYIRRTRTRKKPGRISLEGVEGGRTPGLYMENCSAQKNLGTYRKWVIFWWRAHGRTLSGKRIMPEGVGGPCASGPPSASGLRATKPSNDGTHAFACNGDAKCGQIRVRLFLPHASRTPIPIPAPNAAPTLCKIIRVSSPRARARERTEA